MVLDAKAYFTGKYDYNIVYQIVNFHNMVIVYVNQEWSQNIEYFTTLWPHTVNVYYNRITKVDNLVDNVLTMMAQCSDNVAVILWVCLQYDEQ